MKARTRAIITLTQMVINTPAKLREILNSVADRPSLTALARFRRTTSHWAHHCVGQTQVSSLAKRGIPKGDKRNEESHLEQ